MQGVMNEPDTVSSRRSHVNGDPDVRTRKARKIGKILDRLAQEPSGDWALDVGCGAAFVARHLRQMGWKTVALDLADHRSTSGFDFVFGQAEALPFPHNAFSLVVSSHVIEHVFDPAAHLREVCRVLVPGGLAYIATPNRLSVIEPHYKLPFLSLLPRRMANAYVQLLRRAESYDVFALTRSHLLREAARAGLRCEDITSWMIAETAAVEGSALARIVSKLPDSVLRWSSRLSPTLVFAMRRIEADSRRG
jgi:SAM-dependent methyltransferase